MAHGAFNPMGSHVRSGSGAMRTRPAIYVASWMRRCQEKATVYNPMEIRRKKALMRSKDAQMPKTQVSALNNSRPGEPSQPRVRFPPRLDICPIFSDFL